MIKVARNLVIVSIKKPKILAGLKPYATHKVKINFPHPPADFSEGMSDEDFREKLMGTMHAIRRGVERSGAPKKTQEAIRQAMLERFLDEIE